MSLSSTTLQLAVSLLLVLVALLLWAVQHLQQRLSDLKARYQDLQDERPWVIPGPRSVFSWPSVAEAPPPAMDMDTIPEGQALEFKDGRGAIYRFKLGPDTYVNMYYTKAGYRRSGDLHDCRQFDVVLKGRTRLRMLDANTGEEVVQEYGENEFIIIPPRTPHMFEFLEDNYLLEWWDDEFHAWYYKPYRDIINQGLQLSVEGTANWDLSIDPAVLPSSLSRG